MSVENHREATRLFQQKQRAISLGLPATLTMDEWLTLIDRFHGLCAYCQNAPFDAMDHLIPPGLGGGTTAENCVPACKRCNSQKGGRDICKVSSSFDEMIEQVRHVLQNNVHLPYAMKKPGPRKRYGERAAMRFLMPEETKRYIECVSANMTEWIIQAIREKRERDEQKGF